MNSAAKRLDGGHQINRAKPINFSFDGRPMQGYAGDTLASALLANGEKIIGRSFKLHRPRGLMAAGREEPNALVQLESDGFAEPNVRATHIPLYEGLAAWGQNAWPNVRHDIFGLLGLFHWALPASFYYKSLMWPSWHFYEAMVRRLAGLGKAPQQNDVQQYDHRHIHCEVLIVGAGPAGISAALAASDSGKRVLLLDDQEQPGGSLLDQKQMVSGADSAQWLQYSLGALAAFENVTVMPRTTACGYYDHNLLCAVERVQNHLGVHAGAGVRERLWHIRAAKVVLATGAIERPLLFANNDRPGIMLASAIEAYAYRYGVAAGNRVVIVANNDSVFQVAGNLHDMGIAVAAVIDTRPQAGRDPEQLSARDIRYIPEHAVLAIKGRRAVSAVTIAPHLGEGRLGAATTTIDCDVLGMSGGWSPTVHLWSQAGGSLKYDESQLSLRPGECAQAVRVAGSANGVFSTATVLEEGAAAGHWAAGSTPEPPKSAVVECTVRAPEAFWYTRNARSDKQWVDFQYDVKVADLELAHRENFRSVEHVKRYTTNGMSVDQGKTSNINALAVMAELSGRPIPEVGTTKFRPPYQPVTIGAFAGRNIGKQYAPSLRMPGQDWHVERGGHFADFGGWQRPEYYPQRGEDEAAATRREALAVRKSVGIFEGSPLGKIEVRGPDAAAFLNLVYINNAATLKVGAARYGLMCNENGVVIDDGVFVRLADDHFLLHTTSGGAGRIFQWLEEWLQCEWLNLKVFVTNVTSQWANVTLSGPNAHKVLAKCDSDIDFSPAAFRHMQYRNGEIFGVPARVLRASFTGEASYEINVPARYGYALLNKLEALGAEFDITPYGVESLMTLRAEKGYLHIGADTDGTTNPMDLGWGGAIAKKPGDFIGRRSLSRPVDQGADRLHFVGLQSLNPATPLPLGGHVISSAQPELPVASEGYVTSACISPNLNKAIGLGIVRRGRERLGEQVYIYAAGKTVAAVITSPTHVDAEGSALSA